MNKNEAKILIVDDIEDNRYTLERSLKKDGYENIALADLSLIHISEPTRPY